ncbi:MAG: deacylase [Bacteroidetes bacterium HGW-Bacteroidetes-2]|jgi:hypothetical protein|nr:MAG: deacylase [Bacteroidetes bacterium HGW-Bacteroidetes-2]
MKKIAVFLFCLFGFIISTSLTSSVFSQEVQKSFSLEGTYFYGTVLEHNPGIGHLITEHPEGFILQYNRKTYGFNAWERRYNFPDWGFTFSYQDMKNPVLGELYGVYAHMSWYFLRRNFKVSVAQGIAYATNPYDRDTNFRNNAYGSTLLSTTLLSANFTRENIWNGIGVHIGVSLLHYSNGNVRAPNTSTNTFGLSAGVSYQLDYENVPEFIYDGEKEKYTEPFKYNFVFRSGINESDVIGQGQFPFYVFSAFIDKKISRKSTFQAGADVFYSLFLKELIQYRFVAFPEDNLSGDEDYKRVGLFVGHELRFNKVAFVSQLGYYVYYPYDFEGRIYNRFGLKRYFGESERFFGVVSLKSHIAKAEAIEFGIGIRL